MSKRNNARNSHFKSQIKSYKQKLWLRFLTPITKKPFYKYLQLIDKVAGRKSLKATAARKKSRLHNNYLEALGTSTSSAKKKAAPKKTNAKAETTEEKKATLKGLLKKPLLRKKPLLTTKKRLLKKRLQRKPLLRQRKKQSLLTAKSL